MNDNTDQQLLEVTRQLLDCIARADWLTYQRLCDPTLSAFEPEARGYLVEGMAFHKYYFELERQSQPSQTTIVAPHVRRLGADVALVSYIRLIQHLDTAGQPKTECFEETRVWQRQNGQWRHVHCHRSSNP